MRLIDADELLWNEKINTFAAVEAVVEAPTVDAVQVVRCKDCISSYEFEDWETGEKTRYCQRLRDYWVKEELWVSDNYFCCWGRKKKDVEAD